MNASQLFNYRADYSTVEGSTLPFEFALDTEKSVLDPAEGKNQKFVYTVTAKGKENSTLRDLNYFLLSLNPSITLQDIVNPVMTLNGNVYKNGELSIVDERAKNGRYGLKVLFKPMALSKLRPTVFTLAFEIVKTVAVGPIDLIVRGGNQVLGSLKIAGPVLDEFTTRDTIIYKRIEVCTPVEVTPIVRHGNVTTNSFGRPVISTVACTGNAQKCKFYVRQNMRIRIPLSYSASAVIGSSTTNFEVNGDTVAEFIEDEDCPKCTEKTEDL